MDYIPMTLLGLVGFVFGVLLFRRRRTVDAGMMIPYDSPSHVRLKKLEQQMAHLYQELNISPPSADPDATMDDIQEYILAGQKIQAIKRYRELHLVGLKEAKDAVDLIEAELKGL